MFKIENEVSLMQHPKYVKGYCEGAQQAYWQVAGSLLILAIGYVFSGWIIGCSKTDSGD